MNHSYCVLSVASAVAVSACTFDATGLTLPSEFAESGDESGSTASLPVTDAQLPTTTLLDVSSGPPSATDATSSDGMMPAASDETTVSADAVCGDGVVSGDEECDEGVDDNGDDQICTSACLKARCGDGHLQAANGESCDAGALNEADPGYGHCSVNCARGPYCGDGEVQSSHGEQCEPQGAEGELDACTGTCVYEARVLFVTSVAGDGALGGIVGADSLCNQLADDSELTGTYRAWLLVDGQSLAERFPELVGLQSQYNLVNAAGEVLAKGLTELITGGPAGPVLYDEQGQAVPEAFVWTNITGSGASAGGDCGQWTSSVGHAHVGHSGFVPDAGPEAQAWHTEHHWTDLGVVFSCSEFSPHLYCIQIEG